MNKAFFWSTFFVVFLAEVGDKTQLAAMSATAKSGALWTVFFAASLALVCATAVGVAVGGALFRFVSPQVIRYAAGTAFIAVGVWMLVKG